METLPIEITAEILPGRPAPADTARFANADRAEQYARILIATGYYSGGVFLTGSDGVRHRLG